MEKNSPVVIKAKASGVVMSLGALVAGGAAPAMAQAQAALDANVVLDSVDLQSGQPSNANARTTAISRLPATVREIPKVVNVVPEKVIKEQGVTTLEQTLRNVPGITLSTGEGRGGQNGDQFRIRGLTSRGDVYIDGLRDFGVYTRDTFNTESVEVIKGPSGESFGAGNLGGLINQSAKRATLRDGGEAAVMAGNGVRRATVDYNKQLNSTSALRFSAMMHDEDVVGRDNVEAKRQGVALAYGAGIGTDLEWNLNYSYLKGDSIPDYGVPFAYGDDGTARPIFSYGIPGLSDSTSYVRNNIDMDKTNTHVLTSSVAKKLDGFTLRNDTRLSKFDRKFASTAPGTVSNATLRQLMAGTNRPLTYEAGGGSSYDQKGSAIQNVLTAEGEFTTGGLRHKGQVGLDLIYQEESRVAGAATGRVNNQTVINPLHIANGASIGFTGAARKAYASEMGLFANDRMWFNSQFSVQGSVRVSKFESAYKADGADKTKSDGTTVSPSLALIFEPNADTTLYASFSRTFRPIGTDIASAVGDVPTTTSFEPERADLLELGGKADFLDGRLGVSGAVFRINKKNSYTYDGAGNLQLNSGDVGQSREVTGLELGVSGDLTDNLNITGSYAYLDSKITNSSNAAQIGKTPVGVARHNASIWASYTLPEQTVNLPGKVSVAGGVRYTSESLSNLATATTGAAVLPRTLSYDAVVAYETDKYRVALNGYNLTDTINYGSSFNAYRAVPSTRRSFAVTVSTKF